MEHTWSMIVLAEVDFFSKGNGLVAMAKKK
jgi:hypothetical protein